ncbi:MAG: guanylate kinase, partial [Mycobacteriaceae bacterium]
SGTPARPVQAALEAGRPVLVEVDLAGARAIRRSMPEADLVFLAPPSWEVLVRRLTGRGTEPEAVIARRLVTAREELAAQGEFDHVVVNDNVQHAAADLVALLVGPSVRHDVDAPEGRAAPPTNTSAGATE